MLLLRSLPKKTWPHLVAGKMKCGWYEHNFVEKCQCVSKIVMHKSFGEVSLVEQDTIECVSVAY